MRHRTFLTFFKDFIKDPSSVGAVSPSSKVLARAMIKNLDIQPEDTVLELGPGTGVFTRQICEKTQNYLGIERNPRFTTILHRRFPHLNFVNGLAQDGSLYLEKAGFPHPDVIISGLPLTMWSEEIQDSIVEALDHLMVPGSVFRTFQYAHAYVVPPAIRFRAKMNTLFGPYQRSRVVLYNLPPAFILTWSRK